MSNRNTVVLVDISDNIISSEDKLVAHQQGLLHRAFSVMLYRYNNQKLEFLLQKRALSKYHCPGLWTNTCCSHPNISEDIKQSALSRLQEELIDIDICKIDLKYIGNFIYRAEFDNGLIEHEYDHIFLGEYQDTPMKYNTQEIAELAWLCIDKINEDYRLNKNDYTPWFEQVVVFCKNYLTKMRK